MRPFRPKGCFTSQFGTLEQTRQPVAVRHVWLIFAIGIAGLAGLLIWLSGERPGALESRNGQIRFVYLMVLLVAIGSGLLVHWRSRPTLKWLRDGLLWGSIGLVLVVGYSFRFEMTALWHRLRAELMPGRGVEVLPGKVIVRAGEDRHFHVDAMIDGTPLRLLVDTGASSVVLNRRDAVRLGLSLDTLVFSRRTQTANGVGLGAPVRLREIRIQSIVVRDVPALVNKAPMSSSLLGMSFLERLSGFAVENGTLTLER